MQDESQATYEGWFRKAEARVHWASHVDHVYNIIRGSNPAPGAWTTLEGEELQIFDARKIPVRTFGAVRGEDRRDRRCLRQRIPGHRAGRAHRSAARKLGDGKKVAAAG